MAVYPDIKIATGWNNEAGFTVVESIAVTGTTLQLEDVLKGFGLATNTHFFIRHTAPQQNRVIISDGSSVQSGYEAIQWIIPVCTGVALKHWIDTYVGKMTIATLRYDIATAVENWNVIASYPEYNVDDKRYYSSHWWFFDVTVNMKLVSTT